MALKTTPSVDVEAESVLTPYREKRADDADLKRRVESFLFERNRKALRTVDVDVVQGSVILHGRVNSFYEKQLCLSCCQRVAGVLKLVDEIEVA